MIFRWLVMSFCRIWEWLDVYVGIHAGEIDKSCSIFRLTAEIIKIFLFRWVDIVWKKNMGPLKDFV